MVETDDYYNDSHDICPRVYFCENKSDNEWTKIYKPSIYFSLLTLSE
jgi:hypothetical protein